MTAKHKPATPLEVQLALGRIFRIMSRPYQPGDDDEYTRCRSIIMNYSEGLKADGYSHSAAFVNSFKAA
jgi:hypothetical protein